LVFPPARRCAANERTAHVFKPVVRQGSRDQRVRPQEFCTNRSPGRSMQHDELHVTYRPGRGASWCCSHRRGFRGAASAWSSGAGRRRGTMDGGRSEWRRAGLKTGEHERCAALREVGRAHNAAQRGTTTQPALPTAAAGRWGGLCGGSVVVWKSKGWRVVRGGLFIL
jgi:hypothetical protein